MVIGPLMPYCYCACNCRETCRLTAELFGHSLSEFFLVVALDRLETELMSLDSILETNLAREKERQHEKAKFNKSSSMV